MTGKPVEGLRVRKYNAKEARTGYLLVLPAILGFLFFCVMPILYSAVLSFTDWNVLKPAKFIGLKNYIKLLTGYVQLCDQLDDLFVALRFPSGAAAQQRNPGEVGLSNDFLSSFDRSGGR